MFKCCVRVVRGSYLMFFDVVTNGAMFDVLDYCDGDCLALCLIFCPIYKIQKKKEGDK